MLKSLLKRLIFRGLSYSDRFSRIDWLYRMEDPWNLTSTREKARFEAINEIILKNKLPTARILELGCGEGTHTAWLSKISSGVTGIDLSEKAILRARQKAIPANFRAVNLNEFFVENKERFDLIIASEVLYYLKDVKGALEKMSRFTDFIFVTFFEGEKEGMQKFIPERASSQIIEAEGTRWYCYWWKVGA